MERVQMYRRFGRFHWKETAIAPPLPSSFPLKKRTRLAPNGQPEQGSSWKCPQRGAALLRFRSLVSFRRKKTMAFRIEVSIDQAVG